MAFRIQKIKVHYIIIQIRLLIHVHLISAVRRNAHIKICRRCTYESDGDFIVASIKYQEIYVFLTLETMQVCNTKFP